MFSCLIILIAAIVMGMTGFGFALIIIPLFLLFMDAKVVVVYNIVLGTIVCIPVLWQSRKYLKFSKITILVVSCILGLPVGIYILSHVSSPVLKLLIASMVIIFALLLALGISYKFKREWIGFIVSGLIGGMLMPSIGLGGPPVILFLINQDWEKNVFRANLNAFFIIIGIATFLAMGASRVVNTNTILTSFILVPPLLIGVFIGLKLLPRIDSVWFKRISTGVLILSGVLGVVNVLMVLL